MKRILSIDGGGIKGIIPAIILEEIENRTGKRISEMFDLIAGTSTGGIIALGLAKPAGGGSPEINPSDLIRLYDTEGHNIFHRSLWHRLRSLDSLVEEKYPSKGLELILEDYFGDAKLKDVTCDVLITAYDLHLRQPYFFKSRKAQQFTDRDHFLKDAARGTSAAPSYFEPVLLGNRCLIDGGVFANNPAACAYVEGKKLWGDKEDILMVSLGCGEACEAIPYRKAKGYGLKDWAQPIFDVVLDGVSDVVDYQLREIMPEDRYFRIQGQLVNGGEKMDDTTPDNMINLKKVGNDVLNIYERDIKSIIALL